MHASGAAAQLGCRICNAHSPAQVQVHRAHRGAIQGCLALQHTRGPGLCDRRGRDVQVQAKQLLHEGSKALQYHRQVGVPAAQGARQVSVCSCDLAAAFALL